MSDLNVFSGKNDAGKSNILKALNLFFNNCVVKDGDYKFSENYNMQRLEEVRQDSVKGKQFITIKVTFRRGNQAIRTLPETFTVTKKWNRDDVLPQVSDNIEKQLVKEGKKCNDRSRASLTRFLNNIKYIYIPAIKDEAIFNVMIAKLQDVVYSRKLNGNEMLSKSLDVLYDSVVGVTEELSVEFKKATTVESMIATPRKADELYKTLRIMTNNDSGEISLENRGDGIRVRYLPSILHYIAKNSLERYIWGFEEPENSLEFNMAISMARDFYDIYSKSSTILITTHSPAFIDLYKEKRANGYRCFKEEFKTQIKDFKSASGMVSLSEELGYIKLLQDLYNDYQKKVEEQEKLIFRIAQLENSINDSCKPLFLTEGKTDAQILNIAWKKLYGDTACPVEIRSCNLVDDTSPNAIAGAGILKGILCSRRYDDLRVVIGMFDNDAEGVKDYGLDGNYSLSVDKKWKKHKSKKGFSFVIPAKTEELKKIETAKNLSIELLFEKEYLDKEIDGQGLKFAEAKVITKINGIDIEQSAMDQNSEYWYCAKIKDETKTFFAEKVVPTFDKEAFSNFVPIFEIINEIVASATVE